MSNTLVIYFHRFTYPMRKTIEDHIFSFQKFGNSHYYFVNAAFGIPFYLKFISFDLILYQTTFLAHLRWSSRSYEELIAPYRVLQNFKGTKAILPQDEFLCADRICRFIKDFGVQKVFSVSPESEWEKIYPDIDRNQVAFYPVLTGYLDDEVINQVKEMSKETPERDLDISYRAWHAESWLGRHGLLKTEIAAVFNDRAPAHELKVDISTDDRNTFLGMDWYRFLLRSKYTIGVEGGSSILDFDGSIRQSAGKYLKQNPQASFEEIEAKCFPEEDGKLSLFALSPRHLEACLTKTCQVLIEGEYNGILKEGKHYIPLKKDFSNIEEVLKTIAQDNLRKQIVEQAYQDIVLTGNFSYHTFVNTVMEKSLKDSPISSSKEFVWHLINQIREKVLWGQIYLEVFVWKLLKKTMPSSIINKVKHLKNKISL